MLDLRKSTAIPPSPLYAFMMFIGKETRLPLRSLQPDKNALTGLKAARKKMDFQLTKSKSNLWKERTNPCN